ncbi:glycoside hydrolase family 9 protein [Saccharibacillus sacchari]|uniref:glycoside hydrolase family 9 protein n=1 Tax=Saccharibacillus sacchari TaxID=456493 RepID=UPI0004B7ADFC|nr:glycoside hydrolase family 9 protein [Saccharibacillus sacchari]
MSNGTKAKSAKRSMFKMIGGLLAVSLVFPVVGPIATTHAEQIVNYVPTGGADWNKLRDIPISDYGWGDKVTVVDKTYQGKKGKRIEASGSWMAHYTTNSWQTFDFSRYGANGTLEFDAVGAKGGESFRIGFRDGVHERLQANGEFYTDGDDNPEETNIDVLSKDVNEYKPLTTQWQHYSIPLRDLFGSEPLFDPSQIQLLKMVGTSEAPITLHIANIRVVSPDKEVSAAPIKVNQVGYPSGGDKYALVSGYYNELDAKVGTPFEVKRTSDGESVYSGKLSLVRAYDPSSGEKVLKADFTPLQEAGEYEIVVDGIAAPSASFKVGADVYGDLLTDVQRFFYYQRANDDLDEQHAGEFAREGLHKIDRNLPLQSDPSIKKDVSGGWWDAGDTGKYVTAAATAVSDLLWAYEAYPKAFPDGQLNIPESGNGVSDLLDEIKVETDFFLKMQDPATGGFYAYVIREPEPNRFIMDGEGPESIIPTAQTANTVGALAHASLVFKSTESLEDYSNTLLQSAVKGWAYLEQQPEYIAQPDGPYNDGNDKNDRFYAAAALYRATGEAKYGDYVKAHYQEFAHVFDSTNFSHGINGMEMIGYYHYLSAPQADPQIREWFAAKYGVWRENVLDATLNRTVWGNSTQNAFYWGANSNVASVPVSLAIGSRILGTFDEDNIRAASSNLNYLLGINPLQLSYITGYGENRIRSTHHEIYMRDFIIEMPNGYMAGGPNNSKAKFPAKAYNESTIDWETNEQALNYNSPLIYLTAMLKEAESSE